MEHTQPAASIQGPRPRSVLICHHDAELDHAGLSRWLGSFTDLAGVVLIRERKGQVRRRLRRERQRSGLLRLIDVMAFRLYYRVVLSRADRKWTAQQLAVLTQKYPAVQAPVLETHSPNTADVREFIGAVGCDLMLARCKFILRPEVFNIPKAGTFVLHPGVCPEYRNAHGCFWALVRRDLERVGVTLLRIDEGVDTGPVYGYFRYDYDEAAESHNRIQWRCVLENLDAIAAKLLDIDAGQATRIDTAGRESAVWGQPWLSSYFRWKRHARGRTA
jgi:folate-dependent phosphoribosylglycinamide formyltransferase PurN